ncbi:MAG: hypothetical protein ACQEVD_16195 [Actinomycetota bacterium]
MSDLKAETAEALLKAIKAKTVNANTGQLESLANAYKAVAEATPRKSAYDN